MQGTLGITKSAWEAGTDLQLAIMCYGFSRDLLIRTWEDESELIGAGHTPAQYDDPGAVRWFIFDDSRFNPAVIPYFGCYCANVGEIPPGYVLPATRDELRSDLRAWCENPARGSPLVKLADIVFPEDDPNPWQTILDAQNAPFWVKMAPSVPANWTPMEVGS